MTETIVMIHGMSGGAWAWENYKKFFEEKGYRCIVPTLRYHDVDPKAPPDPRLGTTSLLDYADDLETEIRKLSSPPILMGHSMGGLLAQILGSRGLAKAIVLVTPAAPYGIMALKLSVIRSFWSGMTTWGFWKKAARQTFEEARYSMMHLVPVEERRPIYDKLVFESGRAAFEMGFWLFDQRKASRVDDSKVTCPVLVIAGSQDRMTPASVVRKIARKYRALVTYREFTDHAHWIIGEPGWQEVADYIAGWLNRVQQSDLN